MKRFIIAGVVYLGLVAPASAGFDDGLDAYMRQDYQTAYKELQPPADRGNPDAQNMLGHMYATGRGVLQDFVQAHLWFNLAAVRGKSKAASSRDDVARLMTSQQVAEAQELARRWRPKTTIAAAPSPSGTANAPRLRGRAQVGEIQRLLKARGYEPGPADGLMGWQTRSAIRSYQSKYGLIADGEPSQGLLNHLWARSNAGGAATVTTASKSTTAVVMSQRDMTAETQRHLATLGYDAGPADGAMGWRTRAAVRSYQSKYGLPVDGAVSANLLSHLRQSVAKRKSGPTTTAQASASASPTGTATSGETKKLVRQLKKLVRKGERDRLADPAYLAELRQLVARYDRPWPVRLLHDEFSDGDFSHNPKWTIISGGFTVPLGEGLSSTVAAAPQSSAGNQGGQRKVGAEEVAIAVLSQILGAKSSGGQESSGQAEAVAEPAEIISQRQVGNSFSLSSMVKLGGESVCQLGLYRAAGRKNGYYLQIATGAAPALVRQTGAGSTVIATSEQSLSPDPGQQYRIEWTRDRKGRMRVRLNDRSVLAVRDTAIKGSFDGFSHANRLGQCMLQSITIAGPG